MSSNPSRLRVLSVCVALHGAACASSSPSTVEVPELTGRSKVLPQVPEGSIERKEVDRTVDAGLGAFLQRVSVEPVIETDKFVGFRLTQLEAGVVRKGVDVQVGDVVTHANGRSLEGETEAFEVFQSLKTAREIRLSLLRNGQRRELVIPIIGEPTSAPPEFSADAGTG